MRSLGIGLDSVSRRLLIFSMSSKPAKSDIPPYEVAKPDVSGFRIKDLPQTSVLDHSQQTCRRKDPRLLTSRPVAAAR